MCKKYGWSKIPRIVWDMEKYDSYHFGCSWKNLNIRLTFLVVLVLNGSTYNHARREEERGFVSFYVVISFCQTHTYCDVFRIKHIRHSRCIWYPLRVSFTRVHRDDDDKRRLEIVCISQNSLTIHNLTLLSHLTSSQRDNCHHNGPSQGGLHVKWMHQRRLSKPQGLRCLKREAEGISARTSQEEEIRHRRTAQQEESRGRINCEWGHRRQPYVRQRARHLQAQKGSMTKWR